MQPPAQVPDILVYARFAIQCTDVVVSLVIGGDFNVYVVEWRSRLTNTRSWALHESLAKLKVNVVNVGGRYGVESIIDVNFWSPGRLNPNSVWRVNDG